MTTQEQLAGCILAGAIGLTSLLGCIRPAQSLSATCPNGEVNFGDSWPPFAVVRFMAGQNVLTPPGPLATRTPGDCQLQRQLRFGSLYLVRGSKSYSANPEPRWVRCAQGRDTMHLLLYPTHMENVFVDSVLFRPGYYRLQGASNTVSMDFGRQPVTQSFGEYYQQHKGELAHANPFVGVRFPTRSPEQQPLRGPFGRPDAPLDIFAHLLQRTTYYRVRNYHLVPVHRIRGGRYVPDQMADQDPWLDKALKH